MKNLLSSPTKIVLLFLVGIMGLLTTIAVIFDIAHGTFSDLTVALLAIFVPSVTLVMGYFFGAPVSDFHPTTAQPSGRASALAGEILGGK